MKAKKNMSKSWKALGRKQAEKIYRELREVRDTATMKNTNFGDRNEEIFECTKLWREGWIISPLTEVIEELKKIYNF